MAGLDEVTLPPGALQAVVRALAQAFTTGQSLVVSAPPETGDDLPPLLDPGRAAKLIGVSRNTMDRMIADAQVPSVVLRSGARQRMVRVPTAFLRQLLADLNSGVQVHLADYTARWLESAAADAPEPGGRRSR